MAIVLKALYDQYNYLFNEYKDDRVEGYPLLGSILPVASIISLYLLFVLKWGPKYMENRKPYDITSLMNVYNLAQILINAYIGTAGFWYSYLQPDFSFICQPVSHVDSPARRKLIFITYLYFMTKIIDLLDTVFFVLRKKNKQITFLHVYHHAGMVFGLYIYNKFTVGSHGTLLALINSYVHVIMYSYYFLTSFKPELKTSLWWKKHITQVQLIQFLILFIHFAVPLVSNTCNFPIFILASMTVQNLFMFVLFSDFYIKAYIKSKPKEIE